MLPPQVDHLTKKPKDGERCLKEIQSILVENDISPFEVRIPPKPVPVSNILPAYMVRVPVRSPVMGIVHSCIEKRVNFRSFLRSVQVV